MVILTLIQDYDVPIPSPLTPNEVRQVKCFLLFREQTHDGPLYTQARTWNLDTSMPARAYGQEQINQRYGVKNKASIDPFTAVPMYSQKLGRAERALPDLGKRPFNKEFFPEELHETLDGDDGPASKKGRGAKRQRTLAFSNITSLRTADEIFDMPDAGITQDGNQRALDLLKNIGDNEEDVDNLEVSDEDEPFEDDMDEEYDDEDAGDYNAENYFEAENNDDYDDDDGGGDEGTY
ncbi:putative dna-directed rna polymerase iii subunit protein [Phaeoacremonium minimum UCRPA7]|uniref:DNA-directed RNA polymerase III subunit n=1 Tax=Phaeoacremonium minimum (strain UCR-PA7) TaxID=1286976 RepID=R8BX15_PHAM7|nr:putative dna-directed rna polymerase iii subunit protein [Phaeoacremonium minimum UCRPA7]EOO03898.1 putative dna-directed rna polymerase iii subunit protein [Phaeoacremonium minimum UCRPA7]